VAVSRSDLLNFVVDTLGPEDAQSLRAHIRDRLSDDQSYRIIADEF
jgi:hypothetical protein